MKSAIAILIAVAVLVAFSCSNEGDGFLSRLLRGGGSAVPVIVEGVAVVERSQTIAAPAELEASESVDVQLPDDIAVARVNVTEGEAVNAGDALLRISEEDLASKLSRARTDLRDAQARLEKNVYFQRNRDRLIEEGRIDRTQYDALDADVAESEAAVEKAQRDVAAMEDRSSSASVTSPASGVVSRLVAAPGMTMPAGRPVMTIVKLDPMAATIRLPAADAGAVRPGTTLKFAFPDLGVEAVSGRVQSVSTELDPKDNTIAVKALIPNPGNRLKIGTRARAELPSQVKQRFFVVPEDALIKERTAYFVFTVDKRVAHKVQVIPNETVGDRVEIVRGLKEDDIIVVKGQDKLSEGAAVDIWGK